jgi:hypothetical protein
MSPRVFYDLPHPISEYTFPSEPFVQTVNLDNRYLHIELTDGRLLSIPLWWIPSVHDAAPEERMKAEISRDRKMIIWDPDKCAINDELDVEQYLGMRRPEFNNDRNLTH